MARKIWVQMGLPFLCKKISESKWRAMVWVCDEKVNTVTYSLKKVYKWRSTRWWHSLHTRLMKEDPENRIRWKHKLRWHNQGNVWDEMVTCWAGKEDWIVVRKKKNAPEEKYKFVTFILKLSTEHRKTKNKEKDKRLKEKTPSLHT